MILFEQFHPRTGHAAGGQDQPKQSINRKNKEYLYVHIKQAIGARINRSLTLQQQEQTQIHHTTATNKSSSTCKQ
jgi:hypothetical protein